MKTILSIGFCLALALVSQVSTRANDWPQWRGLHRDAVSTETDLKPAWPAGGPEIAWKAAGLGSGYSGVTVSEGRIYSMGEKGEDSRVFAMDESNGRILWSTRIGKAGAPGWGGFAGPRCSPTVTDGRIFAVGQYGEMACLNAADGKVLWTQHLVDDLGGQLMEWGYSESPLVDGSQVVYTPGGSQGAMAALSVRDGSVIWRTKDITDQAGYSSIIPATIDGVRQYIQMTPEQLFGVAPDSGKVLWKIERKGKTAVIPTPIYHDHHVFVTSGYGAGCNLFKITKSGDTFQAAEVYANKELINHHGGVVLIDGHIYGHSDKGGWTCMNLMTGDVVWKERDALRKGSLVAFGHRLILRQEDKEGTVVLAVATPDGFQETGRFDPPNRSDKNSWPHPVIANGKLYLRDQDMLVCYDLK